MYNQSMRDAMDQNIAYEISKEKIISKSSLRHNGRYYCNLQLTATGHILQTDEITYLDEDNPRYYNGNIVDGIPALVRSEDHDSYFEKFGDFLKSIHDLQEVGGQLQRLVGFGGFGLMFGGKKKLAEIAPLLRSMKEIKEKIDALTPIVKSSLADLTDTEKKPLCEVIEALDKSDDLIARLDTALEVINSL